MGGTGLTNPPASQTTETCTPEAVIIMGRNDSALLLDGWHPVQEGPDGFICRWMSPSARLKVSMPATLSAPAYMRILARVPGELQDPSLQMAVYINDEQLIACSTVLPRPDRWQLIDLPIALPQSRKENTRPDPEARSTELVLTLALQTPPPQSAPVSFVPHARLNNGDLRKLSLMIASIRFAF